MTTRLEEEQLQRFFTTVRKPELFDFIENLIADDKYTPRKKIEIIIEMGEKYDKILSHAQAKAKNGSISKKDIIESATEQGLFNFHILEVEEFIREGINLLASKAREDGGWNLENPTNHSKTWDTAYTLLALHETLKSRVPELIDTDLRRLIEKKIKSGKQWLKKSRRKVGVEVGWRNSSDYTLNVYETSLAVCCLSELGENASKVKGSINLLKNYQKDDGGWSAHQEEEESETGATAFAIVALLKAERGTFTELRAGIGWLLKSQNNDGGWGERRGKKSIVSKTCDAVNALVESGYKMLTPTEMKMGKYIDRTHAKKLGVNWLTKNQRTVEKDGLVGRGWRQDSFHFIDYLNTALAVKTLLINTKDLMYLHMLGSSSIQWLLKLKQDILETAPGGITPRVILSLNEYLSRAHEALSKEPILSSYR